MELQHVAGHRPPHDLRSRPMVTVLHVLPHPGGGAEAYIDILARDERFDHERYAIGTSRSRLRGFASLPVRWPRIAIRARAVDVVHAHGDTAAILAAPLLAGRPSLITTHGLHRLRRSHGRSGAPARRGMRAAIAAAAITICTSTAERDELAALVGEGLRPRLVVIPNGVEVGPRSGPAERARERARLGIGDDELVALFAGRLEPRKEPLAAVEAAARARRDGDRVVLLVAGDGPLEAAIAARAGEAVRPLGFRADIASLYAAADVFILPSRVEGMPMSLLEAMARGLPAIVADAPGSVEAVGETGIVVPPDPAGLAVALGSLAADRGRLARLGSAARERVAAEFGAERLRRSTGAAYERALAERGGPR
jgi:glycosyltransferase involved in cell wall biosynthesis